MLSMMNDQLTFDLIYTILYSITTYTVKIGNEKSEYEQYEFESKNI